MNVCIERLRLFEVLKAFMPSRFNDWEKYKIYHNKYVVKNV